MISRTLGLSKGKYANGVLRSALRLRQEGHVNLPRHDIVETGWRMAEPVFRDPKEHPYLWAEDALSVPAKLVKGWADRWGDEEAFRVARCFLTEPDLSLRMAAPEREAVIEELRAAGCTPKAATHERVLLCPAGEARAAIASALFTKGRVTVQGESALRAAELVGASAGERILDLCAAPGGKTAVLAETGAHVTACDVSEIRLERLRETIERLGCSDSVEVLQLDAGGPAPEGPFDAVTLVSNETSTGVRTPLGPINEVVREHEGAHLLVDVVSYIAGMPVDFDTNGLDFAFAGVQKALALPPGIAVFCVSERYLERARSVSDRGFFLDPVRTTV